MSCERHTGAIVDHACGAEIEAEAAAHLETCAACRRVFDEQHHLLKDLDRQLQLALDIEPSARFVPQVMARVERPAFAWRWAIWWSVPAAAAAVLVLVTIGSFRSGEPRAADRRETAALPPARTEPVTDRTPLEAVPPARPEEKPLVTASRRRVERPRAVAGRPGGIEGDVTVPADQARAIARYLALVRRGALDLSALVTVDSTRLASPTDLSIAPLSIEPVAMTDLDEGIGPGVDRRGPGSR